MYAGQRASSSGNLVRISTPSAVTTTVCSNCADLQKFMCKTLRDVSAQRGDKSSAPGSLRYFSKCCNFVNFGSKTYLLSSTDTAVHLSFSILYSTDPSITIGSTHQTFLTHYTEPMIELTVLDIISTVVMFSSIQF